jgi:hypothetical protein
MKWAIRPKPTTIKARSKNVKPLTLWRLFRSSFQLNFLRIVIRAPRVKIEINDPLTTWVQ